MPNPVSLREFRGRWRRPLTYIILFLYSSLLAWLMGLAYSWVVDGYTFSFSNTPSQLGGRLFGNFLKLQSAVWLLLPVALTATSISSERERGLLQDLLLSPLTPHQIVWGKLKAAMSFAMVLLIVPMPIAALCLIMGGLAPFDFAVAFLLLCGMAVSGAAVGLAASACNRRSDTALLVGMVVGLVVCWPPIIAAFIFDSPSFAMGALFCVIYQFILSGICISIATDALKLVLPERNTEANPELYQARYYSAVTQPMAATLTKEPKPATPQPAATNGAAEYIEPPWVQRMNITNPVMRREVRARLRRRVELEYSRDPRSGELVTKPVTQLGAIELAWRCAALLTLTQLHLLLTGHGAEAAAVWMVGAASVAAFFGAMSFASEREHKTLQPLMMTLLRPRDVVNCKTGAAVLLALVFSAPFCLIAIMCNLNNILMLAAIVCATPLVLFAAALLGLLFSWICTQTRIAVSGAVGCVWGVTSLLWYLPQFLSPSYPVGAWLARRPDYPQLMAFLRPPTMWHLVIDALAFFGALAVFGLGIYVFLCWQLRPQALEKERSSVWTRDQTREL